MALLTNLLPMTQFCKHQELDTLKDLYNQDDNHQELGSFHIRASYAAEEVGGPEGGRGLWISFCSVPSRRPSSLQLVTPSLVITVEGI